MRSEFQGWKRNPPIKFNRLQAVFICFSAACFISASVFADSTIAQSQYDGDFALRAGTVGDSDGDGVPDIQDIDDDNDTITDEVEGTGDTDGDGVIDCLDLDSDNDGIPDLVESTSRSMLSLIDRNGDGRLDTSVSVGENGLADVVESDTESGMSSSGSNDFDGDGIRDFHDLDSDNDGIPDVVEVSSSDTDFNGLYDFFRDLDGDGLADVLASSPILIGDTDADGAADFRDADSDGDQLSDRFETSGEDVDGDGRVDNFVDNNIDGLNDAYTIARTAPTDTDQDGLPDYRDTDSDDDGVSDFEEAFAGTVGSTPNVPVTPFSPLPTNEPEPITLETGESGSVFGCSVLSANQQQKRVEPLFLVLLLSSFLVCLRRPIRCLWN